jgi:hypothetical protein
VPSDFANEVRRLLRQFASSTATGDASSASGSSQVQQENGKSISAPSQVHIRPVDSSDARNGFFSNLNPRGAPKGFTSLTISTAQSPPQRVLLVVKTGTDHRLAQIPVKDITSFQFFQKLRSEYFRLRDIWRRCLSVWRYSHCDFYKVSKRISSRF